MKWSNKATGVCIVVLALLLLIGNWALQCSRSEAVLLPGGKAEFFRGDFFHRDRFRLYYQYGAWQISRRELGGGELIVPFECRYNKYLNLRLEADGRVYWVDREKMTRRELRVVNGEWSYDASDHWHSIFDLDIY